MANYFHEDEFQGWYDRLDPKLLPKLNAFRERWGAPVLISQARGAVGRKLGVNSNSQHNYDKWGMVRAVDIMPKGENTAANRRRAFEIAKEVGFTGIGIYPKWNPQWGIHVDVRVDKEPGNPATWSAFPSGPGGKQEYFGVDKAL